jgi:hypothetical protein
MTDLEQIYICATRYGLGRRTYITSTISNYLCTQELSKDCKAIMARDITEAEQRDELGANCDKESWLKLLTYLKK